jgi:hypothetical protein
MCVANFFEQIWPDIINMGRAFWRIGPLLAHLVHNGLVIDISERPSRCQIMNCGHRRHRLEHCFNSPFKSYNLHVGDIPAIPISSR